jgi:sugar O-acyltransferase (sialic acid O-acetyltransferase NeuD family)
MKEAKPLLIFPYNGNGLEALDCIGEDYRFIGFVDDALHKLGIDPNGYPVYGRDAFDQFPDACVLAVPGGPNSYQFRKDIIQGLDLAEERFARVIHPAASISPLASIGSNVLVMAGAVITGNAVIGSHCCILPNTVIHHDVAVGNWSFIGSNVTIAGNTVVEENCYIGSGTNLMNGIRVRRGALVGLGSNVIGSVPACTRGTGNPAREIRKEEIKPMLTKGDVINEY